MPRTERRPHYVKVRKEHICENCDGIITIGSIARYKNTLGGKVYVHYVPDCPQEAFDKLHEKMRIINKKTSDQSA